jgi:hypothetical protein
MSGRNNRGGSKGKKATTTVVDNAEFQESVATDIGDLEDTISRVDNEITGKIAKVKEWNQKQDENITGLLDRVAKLEAVEMAEKEQISVEDIVKDRMDAFVSGQLEQIVAEKIALYMKGGELSGKVDEIVKGLLGAKDQDGKIVSVKQLSARGNLKSVKELECDEKNFYKSRVYKYDLTCAAACWS